MIIEKLNESLRDEDYRYVVRAYFDKREFGLVDDLFTDDWSKVEEFVWEQVQDGSYCEIVDNVTGNRFTADPDDFDEDCVDASDLIQPSRRYRKDESAEKVEDDKDEWIVVHCIANLQYVGYDDDNEYEYIPDWSGADIISTEQFDSKEEASKRAKEIAADDALEKSDLVDDFYSRENRAKEWYEWVEVQEKDEFDRSYFNPNHDIDVRETETRKPE